MSKASVPHVATFPTSSMLKHPWPNYDFKNVQLNLPSEFRQIAANTSVAQAFQSHTVYSAKSNDSIAYVFYQLIEKRIMAMPILDAYSNNYVAWVDIMDILSFVISRLGYPNSNISAQMETWLTQADFASKPCSELFAQANRNPWVSVRRHDTMQHLIHVMGGWNVHRVAVIDDKDQLTGVVTMSHFLRWLQRHEGSLGQSAFMTIKQLQLGFKEVLTVSHKQIALEAFAMIARNPVGGVAVVDDQNQPVGNISANDFKDIGWGAQMFGKLYVSCQQFLQYGNYSGSRPRFVSVSSNSTLSNLIAEINKYKIHRIYIVDETGGDKELQGVIALGDLLRLLDYGLNN